MENRLEETIALLARTPAALDALLRDLPERWTMRNEGGSTWNVFETVRHLAQVERKDWMGRAKLIRENREIRPVDRKARELEGSLGELLDEFARLRAENLKQLRSWNLKEEELRAKGQHSALGTVTLGELLATWVVHDLTHLHQISRVMAYQYREAVGPWSVYLGVLKCDGHSSLGS